jgi:hypothetical protein
MSLKEKNRKKIIYLNRRNHNIVLDFNELYIKWNAHATIYWNMFSLIKRETNNTTQFQNPLEK